MLGGAGGEFVGGFEDAVQKLLGTVDAVGLTEELLGGGDHAVFAPLFFVAGHGFGDAVGEGEKDVAGAHGDGGLGVFSVGKKADHHSGGLERDGLTAPEDVWGIVPGVDEGEETGEG